MDWATGLTFDLKFSHNFAHLKRSIDHQKWVVCRILVDVRQATSCILHVRIS